MAKAAIIQRLRTKQQNGLYAVAVEMTNRSKRLATRHTDNGTRRNSITQTRLRQSSVLWGIPVASAPHAPYLEVGFAPHWVPARYIGLWMHRHGMGPAGPTNRRRSSSSLRPPSARVVKGLYVGGPGSHLQHAPGGTGGRLRRGTKFVRLAWVTRGGPSKYLRKGKVGHPILQPVAAEIRSIHSSHYRRGFERG